MLFRIEPVEEFAVHWRCPDHRHEQDQAHQGSPGDGEHPHRPLSCKHEQGDDRQAFQPPRHDEHGTDAIDVAALIVRIRLCTDALEKRIVHDLHRPNQTHHRHRRRCVHGDGRGEGSVVCDSLNRRDGHGETVRRTRGLCRAVRRRRQPGLDERMGRVSQPLQEIRLLSGYALRFAPSAVKRDARRNHMIRAATALAPLPTTKA